MADTTRRDWERAISEIRDRLAKFLKAVGTRRLSQTDKRWIRDQIATIKTLLDQYAKKFTA